MKILLIAQEPPLSADEVVSGNAIRARQLTAFLEQAGHEVAQAWHDAEGHPSELSFRDRDELRGLLMRVRADVHLVGYWELLDLMPFDSEVPLVLDFLAPRPLEQVFDDPASVRFDLRRLQVDLGKVDLLLTGNELQRSMMLLPLLEAGLDLGRERGAVVVPLGAELCDGPASEPAAEGWTLVGGGVNWPWRRANRYWRAIERLREEQPELRLNMVLFGGGYALDGTGADANPEATEVRPLLPYAEFSAWLTSHGHIGLELADDNVERQLSQSFRAVEFLRHGLPIICNRWLPLAATVREYDAGWLVDRPEDLAGLLRDITGDADGWRRKSANALRLARERLDPAACCAPLLEWLRQPHKARRLPRQATAPPELRVPPWKERVASILLFPFGASDGGLRGLVFRLQKRLFGNRPGDGVVLITRGDLFPADHGAAVKIVETARGLSRLGLPVALVTDQRRHWWEVRDGEVTRRRIPLWIRLLSPPGLVSKALHYSKDIPVNNAFLYLPLSDSSFFWRTLYTGRKVGARVLQAEFPAYVRPGIHASRVLGAALVLVEHNVEYERIRSQVQELTEEQYQRYKAIEVDLCNRCDAVICVSHNDRQRLAMDGVHPDRLYTVPHGVDLAQFELPAEPDARERFGIAADAPLLVFHGTFSYPPNLQALSVFANELLPRLERAGLNCHVLAVGREAPDRSPHPRIHFVGSVDKVGPWLKAADLAVVPLLDGGGTRMKIIDCFAARIPVISTSKGIEGIPVINGEHALVIDDWDGMAAAIQRLLANPAAGQQLTAGAYEMAAALDWKSIAADYVDIFNKL
jgi:glycosyltransferase involved in cell wall biosynthesis